MNFDLTGVSHHPAISEITEILCNRTGNNDRGFFNTEVAYFLGKMASNMRTTIVTKDRGEIPVNIYALALATSGFGKGHSVNIMEEDLLGGFKTRFMDDTLTIIAEQTMHEMAKERAKNNGSEEEIEFDALFAEHKRGGAFPFTFDSGTPPAVKQLRQKLVIAGVGSINLQIDEIGSNLIGSTDVLTLFLELYDQGKVKQKLIKNTAENIRAEEIDGKTPTNMLLFGTPSKLLDGGLTEDQFYSMLETGYARRCLFGIGITDKSKQVKRSAAEIYADQTKPSNKTDVKKWSAQFHKLADPAMHGRKIDVPDDVAIKLIEYKLACEEDADQLGEHEDIKKAELSHRYFKALKLAGAYAFVDESDEVLMQHLLSAILLVEESGAAFQTILNREKTYVKLARYIAEMGKLNIELTHADMTEALPYYKTSNAARNELMTLATAWGYRKHIIIKKSFIDGIEFFKGETLKETDITKLKISYSDHFAYNYLGEEVPFDQMHVVMQQAGYNWANHYFKNQHRAEENVLAGFNMIVLDVDGGVDINMVHSLLKEYKFMTYTTKSHTEDDHCFRIVLPINYYLELDSDDYKEFMQNVVGWLPFKVDESANQRARKWASHAGGDLHYNMDGEIMNALDFIPKTSKNDQYRAAFQKVQSLDNLERWFAVRMASGNRNNNMAKFAFALLDSGIDLLQISDAVMAFNKKLGAGALEEDEIQKTILVSVAKRFSKKTP